MSLLFPKLPAKQMPFILVTAFMGASIAGLYGIVHDQITYALAPEYFTNLKFHQFAYARNGFPDRIFAGVIGFLATWWAGLVAGWFLGRMAGSGWPRSFAVRRMAVGFAIVLGGAFLGGLCGFLLGTWNPNVESWRGYEEPPFDVTDLAAFVRVAYIHNGGYIGSMLGLLGALLLNRRAHP